jgi:threonine dehydrogenase-like Zn-dependent dehydrogenase
MVSRLGTGVDVSVVDVSREPTRVKPDVRGIDYLVFLCGDVEALERWMPALNDQAVVNVFAGLEGASLGVEARDLCSRGIRVIGHSGTNLHFQTRTLSRITSGEVDVAPVVAAVGGVNAVRDALKAASEETYPGKIVIYLDVDFPLTPVDSLTGGRPWSAEAERKFLARFS